MDEIRNDIAWGFLMLDYKDFDITSPPPAKDTEEVGKWAWTVYELSRKWRDDELQMPEVWRENHKLYHGNHWGERKKKNDLTINLFFANIVRTVANLTSKKPVAEAVDLDGTAGEEAKKATARIRKWWLDTKQQIKLRASALNSEIYGITWEKSVWDHRKDEPATLVCDPFAIFPYPGYWENIALDCPAICHATALAPSVVAKNYNKDVEEIEVSETYSLLGGEREEVTGISAYGSTKTSTSLHHTTVKHLRSEHTGTKGENALLIEVWCRDFSTDKKGNQVYPDGIRKIAITNEGKLVLDDQKNPNLNFEHEEDVLESNYMWGRLPFYKNNSYIDTSSIFGFSAAEQTAPLVIKINELVSKLVNYAMRAMTGILVIPPNSGITRRHLNSKPNLIVFPQTIEAAKNIKIIPFPNPPAIIDRVIDMLISMHDRVHAIEDADRGNTPNGITAASAIVALQEKNHVLIQHKIEGMDSIVGERGNYAIAQWQMHGHKSEAIKPEGEEEPFTFRGTDLAGLKFNYAVESGSMIAKTSLQLQEQAMSLAKDGHIDSRAVLETLNFPGWREIVERTAEGGVEGAMNVLVQAGLPEQVAMVLAQEIMQPQGGPGDEQKSRQPQPGVPRAYQGEVAQ